MPGAAGAGDEPPSSGELDDAEGWQSVRDAIVETIEAEGWTDVAGGALLRMFEACEDGDDEAMAQLLAEHPDLNVNAPGPDGDRALNLACLYGHLGCAKSLLDRGANASLVNEEDGSTALHDAAAGGYLDICQLVLDRAPGLVTVADEDGDTPLHNAARGNHVDVVTLLLSSGADPNMRNSAGNTPAQEAEEEDVVKVLNAAVQSEGAADA